LKNKQIEELIAATAEQLNMPSEDVAIIVKTYYEYVQNLLRSGEHPHIQIPKIGFLYIVEKRLNKRIEKLEKISEYYQNNDNMRNFGIRIENQKTLDKLYIARKKINEERERRSVKRKERKEYEHNYHLERKRKNTGGNP